MKSLRLLAFALLACAAALSVSVAFAGSEGSCSAHGARTTTATTATKGGSATVATHGGCTVSQTRATTAGSGCTREMAAQCTPEMREICAQNPDVAKAMGCDPNLPATRTASMGGKCDMKSASAAAGECSAHGTKTASMGGKCDMKGASAAGGECSAHGTKTASAGGKCDMKTTSSAAGMVCKAHLNSMAHDCDACEEWVGSDKDVRSLGGKVQVVSLKNGVMIVYTAEKASDVRALQSAVAKRNEKLTVTLSDASQANLCDDCKHIRGAVASGKLHREVVNIERGCMTLITSEDRAVVQRIRSMAGQPVAMR